MVKKLCCIALAILAIPSVALSQNLPDLKSLRERIKPEVSAVRSLDFVRQVPVHYYSAEDISTSDISEFYPQAYLDNYDQIIRTIGLYRGADSLNSEMLTGSPDDPLPPESLPPYYEPADRSIYIPMREYPPAPEEGNLESIMAHELTHALQDMHFGLDGLLTDAKNSDQVIARQALVEGGARLVEILVDNARAGLVVPDSILQRIINDVPNVMPEDIPIFLFEQYNTPYERGRAFVFALRQEGGWAAVNRAYANPPSSSEHILHPDKYIAGQSSEEIALPDLARESFAGDWELLDTDTLGEIGFRIIFNAFELNAETAHAAAEGWHGDQYAVFKHQQENTFALVLFTTWDTERDATEFKTAYEQNVLAIKWRGAEDFMIEQRGTDVLIAESPRDLDELFAYVKKVRSALAVFDFNGDHTIDFADFLAFAAHFGRSSSDPDFDPRFDFDADGMVGFSDFLAFAAAFGKRVAPTPNAKPAIVIDSRFIHRTLGFVR